ncbi:hypothetical protein [Sphingomonas canadensis]|uniref:hypothetical protein n=1 Tax=Sphingomonas canadensis TaxID=1219257 RepID=UPI00222EBBA0|nr:hypothetical protein [Sphingomonas canadensis]
MAAIFLVMPTVAAAQERHAVRPGFAYPKDREVKIVVFRPDVRVGTLTAGGLDEPNADWTATARTLIAAEIERAHGVQGATVSFVGEPEGEDGVRLAQYRALFGAVADAIMIHRLFVGNRLQSKKEGLDWTLGEGVSALADATGADYGLFLFTHDAYGSSGRKAAQIFGAMFGVAVIPGIHVGYAGLIDLKTGDVIWLNADPQMGGDVRTPEGAQKRVGQLLDGLPGRPVEAPATAKRN